MLARGCRPRAAPACLQENAAIGNIQGQRQAVDDPGSLNPRQGADLGKQQALKLAAALFVVALRGEIVGQDGGMLRLESKIQAERVLQAAHHQNASDQQDHGESHLRGDQNIAQVQAAKFFRRRFILDGPRQAGARGLQRGRQAEQERR
jgi:hypothetical protein